MRKSQSPPRRQRACVPCSKAKARCHFENDSAAQHVCDRCEKMGIECTAKTTRSLRKARQIKPLNSRVSSLEQRLETLVSTLEERNAQAANQASSSSSGSGASKLPLTPGPALAFRTPESAPTPFNEAREDTPRQPQKEPERPAKPIGDPPLGLTWPQADRILSIFREKYMNNFPFVVIGQDVSAQQLLEGKPFLFRAIMLVAAPLPIPRVKKIKRNVLAYLGTHLLVEEERDFEVFQGLLVCIAWADFKNLHDEQITTMTYLALGFAHNLNVTKIPLGLLQQLGMDNAPEDVRMSKRALWKDAHSAEEQRSFLGCFCLLSANSTQFGRTNPIKSQYVNICCDSLNWTRGYPSDFFLERTVRIVQMGEKISEAFGAANDQERSKPYLFLVEGHARGFRGELDRIMESLSDDQAQYESVYGPMDPSAEFADRKKFFTLYYNYLLVRLYEPATYLPEASTEGGAPSMYRSMCLRNCLFAAKAYYETLLELAPVQYLYLSVNTLQQTTFIMVITTRLLLIDSPDWNVEFARMTLDFVHYMSELSARALEAERLRAEDAARFVDEMGVAGVTEEELKVGGRLTETAEKTGWIRDWFAKRISGDEEAPETVGEEEGVLGSSMPWHNAENGGGDAGFGDGWGWSGGLLGNQAWNFDDMNI